jgi:hypothetical protein
VAHWEGVSDAIRALDQLSARIDAATEKGVSDGTLLVQKQARLNATVDPQVRTGALRNSITTDGPVATGPHSFEGRTYPTVVYSRIIELGGEIHIKRAPWLVFEFEGHLIRKKSVTIRPHPYLSPALTESQAPFLEAMKARWGEALGG